MPVRTRSHDPPENRKMKKQEKLYPSLDDVLSPKKHSPAGRPRNRKRRGDSYRDSSGNETPDTESFDEDTEDEFDPKPGNLSRVSQGSRGQSFNINCQSESLGRDFSENEDIDDSHLNASRFSQPSPRSPDNSRSFLNSSSPHLHRRHEPDQSPERIRHAEAVAAYSNTGDRIWVIPDFCIYCILTLFVLALLYGIYLKKVDEAMPIVNEDSARFDLKLLDKRFEELREKFPNQTERHWKIIRVQLKKLFIPGPPTQPAIILLIAKPHASEAMTCIAKEVGRVVMEMTRSKSPVQIFGRDLVTMEAKSARVVMEMTRSKSPVQIFGRDLVTMEAKSAKLELDEKLSNGFQSGHRVAIMYGLEQFHGESLLLLHSYCDHENAAYKSVAIIFTLRLDVTDLDKDINEEFIEDYLAMIWQNKVGVDEMGALRSRIANNKAICQAETEKVLNKQCS